MAVAGRHWFLSTWLRRAANAVCALTLAAGLAACAEGGRDGGGSNVFPFPDSGTDNPPDFDAEAPVPDASIPDATPDATVDTWTTISLTVISGSVFTTKVNGDNWDFSGTPPDLVATVFYDNNTKSAKTSELDSFVPKWNETIIEGATEAELAVLTVQLEDMDDDELLPSNPDKVGRCSFDWNPLWLTTGPTTLSCNRDAQDPDQSGFGLYVEFKVVESDSPPTI